MAGARCARSLAPVFLCLATLSGCQSGAGTEMLSLKSETGATDVMVLIARSVQTCWFKSKEAAFSGYRMANEVNSPAGRPRILIVPKSDPDGLPLLVIQAESKGDAATGSFTDIQTFGPILTSAEGKRVVADVRRWANGDNGCA